MYIKGKTNGVCGSQKYANEPSLSSPNPLPIDKPSPPSTKHPPFDKGPPSFFSSPFVKALRQALRLTSNSLGFSSNSPQIALQIPP